jgi:transposase
MKQIEIITSSERRRYWRREEKERWVAALEEPGAVAADVARRAGVAPSLLYRWRQQLSARRPAPSFVPVAVAPAQESAPPPVSTITIEFQSGARLKIDGAPDAGLLASVIGALSKAERSR